MDAAGERVAVGTVAGRLLWAPAGAPADLVELRGPTVDDGGLFHPPAHAGPVAAAAFVAEGRLLCSAAGREVAVWELAGGVERDRFALDDPVRALAGRGGLLLVATARGRVEVWRLGE